VKLVVVPLALGTHGAVNPRPTRIRNQRMALRNQCGARLQRADIYPESVHVQSVGLDRADDTAVWDFDRLQNLVIVTKDADFQERSLIAGAPPKVVWIRRGNCPASDIESNLKYIAPGATL